METKPTYGESQLFNYVANELTYGESQQKFIDTVRKSHFYCMQTYEKILKEYRDRIDKTDDIDMITSYQELIIETEKELADLNGITASILYSLDVMQQDLDSLK